MKTYEFNEAGICVNPDAVEVRVSGRLARALAARHPEGAWVCGVEVRLGGLDLRVPPSVGSMRAYADRDRALIGALAWAVRILRQKGPFPDHGAAARLEAKIRIRYDRIAQLTLF